MSAHACRTDRRRLPRSSGRRLSAAAGGGRRTRRPRIARPCHLRRAATARPGGWPLPSTRWGSAPGSGWPSSAPTRPGSSSRFFGVSGFGRVLVPINFRLNADEIALHHRALRRVGPARRPRARRARSAASRPSTASCSTASTDAALFGRTPATPPSREPWDADEDATAHDQLHVGHDRAAQGRAADPPQLLAQRRRPSAGTSGSPTATCTCTPCRCSTATAGACPTRSTGDGRPPGRDPQDRRRGDPAPRRGRRASRCCAARRRSSPPILDAAAARRERGETVPGRGPVRIVVAGAPPPSKTIERVEAELGWEFIQIYGLTETSPLLTINRAPAEWDGLDAGRAGQAPVAGRGAGGRACGCASTRRARCSPAPTTSSRGTGTSPTRPPRRSSDGWFHTGDGGELDGAYVVISDRKKDVIITGGENVSSIEVEDCLFQHPGRGRGRGHRRARRQVGRDGQGARRAASRPERRPRQELIEHCRDRHGALQVPDVDRVPRRARPHGHGQAPEVQAAPARTGRAGTARSIRRPRRLGPARVSRSGSDLVRPGPTWSDLAARSLCAVVLPMRWTTAVNARGRTARWARPTARSGGGGRRDGPGRWRGRVG